MVPEGYAEALARINGRYRGVPRARDPGRQRRAYRPVLADRAGGRFPADPRGQVSARGGHRESAGQVPRIRGAGTANPQLGFRGSAENQASAQVRADSVPRVSTVGLLVGLRTRFAQRLVEDTLADTPITVIQGARQVGKTTLAGTVVADRPARVVSLDATAQYNAA